VFTCNARTEQNRTEAIPSISEASSMSSIGDHRHIHGRPLENADNGSSINQCRHFVSSHDLARCKGLPSNDRLGGTFEHDDVDHASILPACSI
jgi:hypothetical protein